MNENEPVYLGTWTVREVLISIADEWQNDYLTVATYAEHTGLTPFQAAILITLAQEVRESKHPDS